MEIGASTLIALGVLGIFAGWLGAMIGIGGGVVLVPALVLLFRVDVHTAVATSLVAVVATSTAAGSVYVGSGLANMRLGMTLEVATTIGGIAGGLIAVYISPTVLSAAFGIMMAATAILVFQGKEPEAPPASRPDRPTEGGGWEERAALAGGYLDEHTSQVVHYRAVGVPLGGMVALLAGALSGLLGVGGGFLKVPAMTLGMKVPIRVAAATSNFMIGVTGISSLFVYFARGFVHPFIAAPTALGVIAGSFAGTAMSGKVPALALRWILSLVLTLVALEMILSSVGVRVGR